MNPKLHPSLKRKVLFPIKVIRRIYLAAKKLCKFIVRGQWREQCVSSNSVTELNTQRPFATIIRSTCNRLLRVAC